MDHSTVTRRQLPLRALIGLSAGVAVATGGCAYAPHVIIVILQWIGVIATTGYLVLRANEQYWKVESAKLDAERKKLELEGVRGGQRVCGHFPHDREMTDDEIKAVREHRRVVIEWADGKQTEHSVTV